MLLFVTLVGIPVAIGLALAVYLLWTVGATVGYVAIALRIVDREAVAGAEGDGDWLRPLLVAAGLNGALALSGVGVLVSLVVGAAGFGVVVTHLTE